MNKQKHQEAILELRLMRHRARGAHKLLMIYMSVEKTIFNLKFQKFRRALYEKSLKGE